LEERESRIRKESEEEEARKLAKLKAKENEMRRRGEERDPDDPPLKKT